MNNYRLDDMKDYLLVRTCMGDSIRYDNVLPSLLAQLLSQQTLPFPFATFPFHRRTMEEPSTLMTMRTATSMTTAITDTTTAPTMRRQVAGTAYVNSFTLYYVLVVSAAHTHTFPVAILVLSHHMRHTHTRYSQLSQWPRP